MALVLAVKHPELVRTLTLAEPPVVFAGDRPEDAKGRLIKQARAAFEKGDPEAAVRAIIDSSRDGTYDRIPEPVRRRLLCNARELEALVTSDQMYPGVDRDAVRKVEVPTLLLSGEKTPASLKSVDAEPERLLPERSRQRVIIRARTTACGFNNPRRVARPPSNSSVGSKRLHRWPHAREA
jgi:pimeloyl-ACP methyl ester carboxylesterase